MASAASSLINSIARRVRDANNTAHSRALVRDLIDKTQVVVNEKEKYVLTSTILTTAPGQALYSVETDLGSSITPTEIVHDGTELEETTWELLHRISPTWITDSSDTPRFWAKIGRSVFAIYPTPLQSAQLEVTASKITTPLLDDDVQLELRKEEEDIVQDIVTAMLMLRQRDLDTVPGIIERAAGKLGLQQTEMK